MVSTWYPQGNTVKFSVQSPHKCPAFAAPRTIFDILRRTPMRIFYPLGDAIFWSYPQRRAPNSLSSYYNKLHTSIPKHICDNKLSPRRTPTISLSVLCSGLDTARFSLVTLSEAPFMHASKACDLRILSPQPTTVLEGKFFDGEEAKECTGIIYQNSGNWYFHRD